VIKNPFIKLFKMPAQRREGFGPRQGIAIRLKAKISFFAPTGLRNKAQGCGESRYPGTFPMMIFNPNGVA
jgi:hypothetical protein